MNRLNNVEIIFHIRLKGLMRERGLEPKDLEDYGIVSSTQINKYLDEENLPSIRTICKLADFFGVSVDYLCGRGDDAVTQQTSDPFTAMEFDIKNPPWRTGDK